MRYIMLFLVLAGALGLAGCGASNNRSAAPKLDPSRGERVAKRPCRHFGAKQHRAEARLARDVRRLRRAADTPTRNTFLGNAAVNKATDRFLLDEETAPLDHYTRNRYINLAASALAGSCSQCFQALEANRPIVNLGMNEPGALPCPGRKS